MPGLRHETVDRVDAYWASYFGCPVGALRSARPTVLAHPASRLYAGVYAMSVDASAPIAAVPPAFLHAANAAAASWTAASVRNPDVIGTALGESAGQSVGPAWIGYCDKLVVSPAPTADGVRTLERTDPKAVASIDALRFACPPHEWEHGGDVGSNQAIGVFVQERLVALASYELWGESVAHIAVVVHPAHRGQHYARSAVAELGVRLLNSGLVPQYRTLEANVSALRVGRSLGFIPYAVSMAVRHRGAAT